MRELEEKSRGKLAYKTNPKYHKLVNRNYILKKKIQKLIDEGKNTKLLRKEFVRNIRLRNRLKSTICNPEYTKISYVRYADD